MDEPPTQVEPEPPARLARPSPFRDILIVGSPIVVMGVVGNIIGLSTLTGGAIINLGYLLMVVVGGLLLKRQGSSWRKTGLGKPNRLFKTLLLGVLAFIGAVVVFVLAQNIAVFFITALGFMPTEIDQSRFNAIEGNLPLFILLIILAWTTIAFGEEMFFRSFLITRMTDFTTIKPTAAILIAGVVFGVVHFAEGPLGILSNGAFGVLFGWIFLRSGRNLWITIIGHGLINTLRFALLYLGAV